MIGIGPLQLPGMDAGYDRCSEFPGLWRIRRFPQPSQHQVSELKKPWLGEVFIWRGASLTLMWLLRHWGLGGGALCPIILWVNSFPGYLVNSNWINLKLQKCSWLKCLIIWELIFVNIWNPDILLLYPPRGYYVQKPILIERWILFWHSQINPRKLWIGLDISINIKERTSGDITLKKLLGQPEQPKLSSGL